MTEVPTIKKLRCKTVEER